jgi:NAD(P)-dependent dehydrogenase (short-subunit alcohol dehydrogenase family)
MNLLINEVYDFSGKTILITGGAGVLCSQMAVNLAHLNANVVILDFNLQAAENLVEDIKSSNPKGCVLAIQCNVLDQDNVRNAFEQVISKFGEVDALINGAGGNKPGATTSEELSFFDLPESAIRWVFDLNLMGTIIPSQIAGRFMAQQKDGIILNISSMNAFKPLTRIPAYSAAKAGVSNFTQWLAVHMAQEYAPTIRVNAIAPGFFLTEQNRFLLTKAESGELTDRGQQIIDHTPMGRFGAPEDLIGTILWLLSSASAFVTGVVIPIDGGFSAFSGV